MTVPANIAGVIGEPTAIGGDALTLTRQVEMVSACRNNVEKFGKSLSAS
jgi:hypothetical protein